MMTQKTAARLRALLTWLLDDGHITPIAQRQIEKIIEEETQ